MKRILVLACLILCLLMPSSAGEDQHTNSWEVDLKNGYISTKPIIVEDQVIVRSSGFWTGEDRPHIYAFDIHTGEENWRFKNEGSTNHDVSPLMHIAAGEGPCGLWSEMILAGWTDGRITAIDVESGSQIWQLQTESESYGITGSMAIDGDNLVVPTGKGLSKVCLSDGTESLRVDLPELGWRNGVTVTQDNYLLGNEEGVLNVISKQGEVSNISIGDGKIRHAPIITDAGVLIHLQTSTGSQIYLDQELLFEEGYSPALPLLVNQNVYLGTSSSLIWLDCSINCSLEGKSNYHANGEISYNPFNDTIWYPHNTAEGGWGTGTPGSQIVTYSTEHDTYTTAGVAFGANGEMAFGNDNGVLMVFMSETLPDKPVSEDSESDNDEDSRDDSVSEDSESDNDESFYQEALIVLLCATMFFFQIMKNNKMATKFGLLLLLVIMISMLPDVSNYWSKEVDTLEESPGDWDDEWPEEWRDTQVIVFELPEGDLVIGGFTDYEDVEEFTDAAAQDLNITITKESYDFGTWITSFNNHQGGGWEFTIDGKRSPVGITEAELEEDSVVRWSPA